MGELNYEDVTRIQSIILSSDYPVEGAKALAEKYPHMQTHQDIYKEHVEVLEKAKAFDRIKDEGDYASDAEEYVNIVSDIVEKFGGQKQ